LETKQASIGHFYEEKIRELARIIQRQEATKRGLERDLSALVKESAHQKHFVEHWRQQLSENIETQPISHHQ
jgi:predicted phage-related endonuclease